MGVERFQRTIRKINAEYCIFPRLQFEFEEPATFKKSTETVETLGIDTSHNSGHLM